MHDASPPLEDPAALRVLYWLAADLHQAEGLSDAAAIAARAANCLLPGRALLVELWDETDPEVRAEAEPGSGAGERPEPPPPIHREPLANRHGLVGEIAVEAERPLSDFERAALGQIAGVLAAAAGNLFAHEASDETQGAAALALATLAEHRDDETGQHLDRMALYSQLLAEGLREDGCEGIDEGFIEDLVLAAPLHDIGKVGIPDSVLLKPGKLTDSEWSLMQTHAELGARTIEKVLDGSGKPSHLVMGRDVAWSHHERWDGSGYPRGLAGEAIPLAARIVALADVYDALTTARPYKRAWSHAEAVSWIRGMTGQHFDPRVVESFLARLGEFDEVRRTLADEPESLPTAERR